MPLVAKKLDKSWSKDGQKMVKRWTKDGQKMDKRWTEIGQTNPLRSFYRQVKRSI